MDEAEYPSGRPTEAQAKSAPEIEEGGDQSMAAGVARSGLWAIAGRVAVLATTFVATPFTIRLLGPFRIRPLGAPMERARILCSGGPRNGNRIDSVRVRAVREERWAW